MSMGKIRSDGSAPAQVAKPHTNTSKERVFAFTGMLQSRTTAYSTLLMDGMAMLKFNHTVQWLMDMSEKSRNAYIDKVRARKHTDAVRQSSRRVHDDIIKAKEAADKEKVEKGAERRAKAEERRKMPVPTLWEVNAAGLIDDELAMYSRKEQTKLVSDMWAWMKVTIYEHRRQKKQYKQDWKNAGLHTKKPTTHVVRKKDIETILGKPEFVAILQDPRTHQEPTDVSKGGMDTGRVAMEGLAAGQWLSKQLHDDLVARRAQAGNSDQGNLHRSAGERERLRMLEGGR